MSKDTPTSGLWSYTFSEYHPIIIFSIFQSERDFIILKMTRSGCGLDDRFFRILGRDFGCEWDFKHLENTGSGWGLECEEITSFSEFWDRILGVSGTSEFRKHRFSKPKMNTGV